MAEIELGDYEFGSRVGGAAERARAEAGAGWSADLLDFENPRERLIRLIGEEEADRMLAEGQKLKVDDALELIDAR